MSFGSKICKYQDDIIRDLTALVAIPSVREKSEEGKPYGVESARALDCILAMAESMGLKTKNVDGYAGHAEYGEGGEIAAVLAHVDVVPVGEGWDSDPFTVTKRGSLYFGRGTADDKGAAVVALYCLKALKDEGVLGKRRLRAIFGAGEETGMDDLEHYFETEPLPQMAFTPDAEYGVCNREKGILHFNILGSGASEIVEYLEAGTVVNAVPDHAEAKIICTEEHFQALQKAAENSGGQFELEKTPDGANIVSHGKAAHAMQPETGRNAASYLVELLCAVFPEQELGDFLVFLHNAIGLETDGGSFGVQQADEPSGKLTFNLGLLKMEASGACAGVDIRYPVLASGEQIISAIEDRVQKAGFKAEVYAHNPPLYLPDGSPFVNLLKDSYREVTGEEAQLYATGGGTYARAVRGRGVAFGPFFQDEPDRRLHNSNEHIDIERFMLHAQICLEAMYRMLTA